MTYKNDLKTKVSEYWNKNPESKEAIIRYLLAIEDFKSFEDWKNTIEIFLNLDDYFLKKHPDKIIELIHQAQNAYPKYQVSNYLVPLIKEESKLEFDYSNFLYALHQEYKPQNNIERKTFPKKDLIEICNRRFERYILSKEKNIEKAFNYFYSCWDNVDEENKVHITNEALQMMRGYIEDVPEQYLKFIIRHQYYPIQPSFSGYYVFVLEPYTKQIFRGWKNYKDFLIKLKSYPNINQHVVKCNLRFFDLYKSNQFELVTIHKSKLKEFKSCSNQIVKILNNTES